MDNLLEKQYDLTYDDVVADIEMRLQQNPDFTIESVKGLLKSAYISLGNDWIGKGELQNTIEEATVAAYEYILIKFQKEKK